MKKLLLTPLILLTGVSLALSYAPGKEISEKLPWSERMALSEMARNPDPCTLDFVAAKKWNYTNGLVVESIMKLYEHTQDERYLDYARIYADSMVTEDGRIFGYRLSNYNLDHVNPGKYLFRLYDVVPEARLKIAIDTLWSQLESQPRTTDGGYWHKKVYPWQMWLDGIYMGDVFKAEYVSRYFADDPAAWEDVVLQFTLAGKHTYDPANGLFRHGWDESREQRWSDPLTGQSAHVWGRGMGWYLMALVDALDYISEHTPGRDSLIAIFSGGCRALLPIQDPQTGCWYQVLDRSAEDGNYLEMTATTMFIYSMLKGVRQGYLPEEFRTVARKSFEGMIENFVEVDERGRVSLNQCCAGAGLGGTPYRDGSYTYYIEEFHRPNDPKGVGPFILAAMELERL
ncbi:MAG: glycoside hydrolase family 88 protein [Rikenellaceae bacterium]|nr:glycoside hydrolase family 88 protein [Rikenellaceae bacterium]